MSGLLRRIKRSRPADAGAPLPEGQAAAPEGAAPATEPATAVTEPVAPEPQAQPEPKTEAPVLLADPDTPAGVDPAAAPLRPPAGRRGRLRRRLRYLRRARELMLRDLGGLLYEVHRTGGGNVEAHGNIVRAKVQRIAGLDAEAHALEAALATSRPEAVVFQPGVGGACPACGEYYGSAARFCSNCGAPIAVGALPAPVQDPTAAPAPATRESVFGRPAQPAQGLSSGDPLRASAPGADQPTAALGAVGSERPTGSDDAAADRAGDASAGSAAQEPAGPVPSASAPEPAASAQTSMFQAPASDGQAAGDDATSVLPPVEERAFSDASPPGDQPAATDEPAASAEPAEREEAAASDQPAAVEPTPSDEPAEREAASDQPAAVEPPASDEPTGSDPHDDAGRNPFARLRNGRAEEEHAPPELSSGDPLATRDTRS